jgi:hypothetical protein
METVNNAELLEIGIPKKSMFWTNLYIKFKLPNGEENWFYYSEHVNKPQRLKQIPDFINHVVNIGDTMTLNYKIVQAKNKSTKLSIINLANYRLKK